MTRKKIEKSYHCILVNPLPFNCPNDSKIEIVKNGQFTNINMYCFSRDKENKDE